MILGSLRRGRVFAYRDPVVMCKAQDTLAVLVAGATRKTLPSGDVFVFIGRTGMEPQRIGLVGGSGRHFADLSRPHVATAA